MATITGYTADRMKQIEDNAIVDGDVVGNDLILTRFNEAQINAGNVRGPQGVKGDAGADGVLLNKHFMAVRTTNLAVSSGVITTIPMPTTIEATLGSGAWSETGVLTIGTAGLYSVGWGILWGSNTTGIRNGHIFDGVGNIIAMLELATSGGLTVMSGQAIRRFASGTTLSVRGLQNSGGSLNIEPNAQRTYFTVTPLF